MVKKDGKIVVRALNVRKWQIGVQVNKVYKEEYVQNSINKY